MDSPSSPLLRAIGVQVTETLDSVQKKVEAYYRFVRRQLFQYDAVTARQRVAVYALRRLILTADSAKILELVEDRAMTTAEGILKEAAKAEDGAVDSCLAKLRQFFGGEALLPLKAEELQASSSTQLNDAAALAAVHSALAAKKSELDSKKPDLAAATARYLLLVQLDSLWKSHLANMRSVQDMVGLRSVAGRDPLLEYQEETSGMYDRMLKVLAYNTIFSFFSYSP